MFQDDIVIRGAKEHNEGITQVDASFTGQFLRHSLPVIAYNSK